MRLRTKICGLTDRDSVSAAINGGAAFLGFMFYPPSPRNLSVIRARELSDTVPKTVKKVAVLVNPNDKQLAEIKEIFLPDYFQLHGNESPERVAEIKRNIKVPVIKAFAVKNADDIARSGAYYDITDMLLFDAKAPEDALPGGNGLSFNWHLLNRREFPLPWMLAGGLNIDNIKEAVDISGARIIDVSSSLEREPGKKDPALITKFLDFVRSIK